MGYSPWGHKELDTTEQPSTAQHKWSVTFKKYESLCCTPETYIIYFNKQTHRERKFILLQGGGGWIIA